MKQNDPGLFDDLREVWTLVTEIPGSSLRDLAFRLNCSVSRSRKLVNILLASGTLVREKNKNGTLRATVPMIIIEKRPNSTKT